MGITILIGQKLGEGKRKDAGNVVGSGISIFSVIALIVTIFVFAFSSLSVTNRSQPSSEAGETATRIFNVLSSIRRRASENIIFPLQSLPGAITSTLFPFESVSLHPFNRLYLHTKERMFSIKISFI